MRMIKVLVAFCLFSVATNVAGEIRGPYMTDVESDRATIVVHTSEDSGLTLLYKEDGASGDSSRMPSPRGQHHVFNLSNLKPGTGYTYQVTGDSGEKGSESLPKHGRFHTYPAEPKPFSFIVYGDSRESHRKSKRHSAITRHFLKHGPGFVIHTGDLLTGGKTGSPSMFGPDWTRNFFLPLTGVFETVPFLMVVGNHDQDSPEALDALRNAFPSLATSLHYSFQVAGSRFIVLHVANQMKEFEAQKKWFEDELMAAKDADWRIVLLHVSPFTNGKYRTAPWTLEGREDFLRTCVRLGVDLVLSGHDHSYQRFFPLKATKNDAHAVLFVVTGLAGTNPYPAEENSYTARVINRTDHFCVVHVKPDELRLTAYDGENSPIDQTILRRGAKSLSKVWQPVKLKAN